MLMNADLIRMNPQYRAGDFYGMLFVEFNKDRIFDSIKSQQAHILEAVNASQQTADSVMSRNLQISFIIVTSFLGVISIIAIPLIKRTVIHPVKAAIDSNQQIAEYLSSAASQLRSASETIARGATEQAASLQETSSSLEQITAMTRNNADNAAQADKLAEHARKTAEVGVHAIAINESRYPGYPRLLR